MSFVDLLGPLVEAHLRDARARELPALFADLERSPLDAPLPRVLGNRVQLALELLDELRPQVTRTGAFLCVFLEHAVAAYAARGPSIAVERAVAMGRAEAMLSSPDLSRDAPFLPELQEALRPPPDRYRHPNPHASKLLEALARPVSLYLPGPLGPRVLGLADAFERFCFEGESLPADAPARLETVQQELEAIIRAAHYPSWALSLFVRTVFQLYAPLGAADAKEAQQSAYFGLHSQLDSMKGRQVASLYQSLLGAVRWPDAVKEAIAYEEEQKLKGERPRSVAARASRQGRDPREEELPSFVRSGEIREDSAVRSEEAHPDRRYLRAGRPPLRGDRIRAVIHFTEPMKVAGELRPAAGWFMDGKVTRVLAMDLVETELRPRHTGKAPPEVVRAWTGVFSLIKDDDGTRWILSSLTSE
jgi:hypothetical protein